MEGACLRSEICSASVNDNVFDLQQELGSLGELSQQCLRAGP